MKNSKPVCVLACIIALVLGFSALAQAQTGSKNKDTQQYYQCKDLRGKISLQAEPCAGVGVTQTEIDLDGTPKSASPDSASGSASGTSSVSDTASDISQDATALVNRYATFNKAAAMEKLQQAKADKPFILLVFIVLVLLSLWHGVVLLLLAFDQNVWWGIAYLFVPVAGLVYVIMYWHDTKKPFLVNMSTGILAGLVLVLWL